MKIVLLLIILKYEKLINELFYSFNMNLRTINYFRKTNYFIFDLFKAFQT